jgi:hypothetical protein
MDSVLKWVFPEFFLTSLGISRRRLALIVGSTLTFAAIVGIVCVVLLGKESRRRAIPRTASPQLSCTTGRRQRPAAARRT